MRFHCRTGDDADVAFDLLKEIVETLQYTCNTWLVGKAPLYYYISALAGQFQKVRTSIYGWNR